jgi:outer membrane protein
MTTNDKRWTVMAVAAAAATMMMAAAQAAPQEAGPWLVRARIVGLQPANQDGTGLDLGIDSKLIPEVDVSYFFTPDIAAELVLTYPQKQDLRSGSTTIGTLKHLPPTLSLQYHVSGLDGWRPYIGAGVNYTRFSSVNLPAGVTIDRNSWGPSIGAGVDVVLGGSWLLNLDVKKVLIRTDVSAGGANLGTFKVDPVLIGAGVGYRF